MIVPSSSRHSRYLSLDQNSLWSNSNELASVNGERTDSKTKALFIAGRKSNSASPPISFDALPGRHISFVKSFKYLGTIITDDLDDTMEIQSRIQATEFLSWKMRRILRNTGLPKKLRARFYVQGPLNKLLYGIESCALTKNLRKALTSFHNKQARRIHGSTRRHHPHQKLTMESTIK